MRYEIGLIWRSPDLNYWVRSVTWSPDGSKIGVTGDFENIVIYEKHHNDFIKVLDVNLKLGCVGGASWSPNGRYLAFGTSRVGLAILDITKKEVVFIDNDHERGYATCWSSDGEYVVSSGHNFIALYKFREGKTEKLWEITEEDLEKAIGDDLIMFQVEKLTFYNNVIYAGGVYDMFKAFLMIIDRQGDFRIYIPKDLNLPMNSNTSFSGLDILDGKLTVSEYWHGKLLIYEIREFNIVEIAKIKTCKGPTSTVWLNHEYIAIGELEGLLEIFRFNGTKLKQVLRLKVANDNIAWGYGLSYNPKYKLLAIGSFDHHVYVYGIPDINGH